MEAAHGCSAGSDVSTSSDSRLVPSFRSRLTAHNESIAFPAGLGPRPRGTSYNYSTVPPPRHVTLQAGFIMPSYYTFDRIIGFANLCKMLCWCNRPIFRIADATHNSRRNNKVQPG